MKLPLWIRENIEKPNDIYVHVAYFESISPVYIMYYVCRYQRIDHV
jgi:hypothetical protein